MNAQEQFWQGEFGTEYQKRSPGSVEANVEFFRRALRMADSLEGGFDLESAIEFGAGVGNNLLAIRKLLPIAHLSAVEINEIAVRQLFANLGTMIGMHKMSILEWKPPGFTEPITWDLAFTKGLLIHIAPDDLPRAYETLHSASSRYILIAEYYNPKPVEIEYRGHSGKLWKRDFAGEMLDRFNDLRLIDYGFVYHRDQYPQDDLNWFLLSK